MWIYVCVRACVYRVGKWYNNNTTSIEWQPHIFIAFDWAVYNVHCSIFYINVVEEV